VGEHDLELNALRIIWSTLRREIAPDLGSALAKDRAKRTDAALARLVAGYEYLPEVRRTYAPRFAELLERARSLADGKVVGSEASASDVSERGRLAFVGVTSVADELESTLVALARDAERDRATGDQFEQLIRNVVNAESSMRSDYEQRVMRMMSATGVHDVRAREVTTEALERYLRGRAGVPRTIKVKAVNEIPGGRSKRTVLVKLEDAAALPDEVVLRLDTGRGVGTSVTEEYPLLDRVARLRLPVPEPLWLETSSEPFGFPFIVFRRMPGAAAGDLIEGAFRKEPATARALAKALAKVHAGGRQLIEDPSARESAVSHTRELLTHYFEWWRSRKPFPSLTIEAAFLWLFRRIGDGLGGASVVHADTGFHNLLLDADGNGCLLDWEFAHLGDPAEDLASCRPAVEKCMPWPEFMAEYRAHGGEAVSDFRLAYFEIWRPLRNAVVCGTVLHSLMDGEAEDIDPVTIALSTFARLQADLASSLNEVLGRDDRV